MAIKPLRFINKLKDSQLARNDVDATQIHRIDVSMISCAAGEMHNTCLYKKKLLKDYFQCTCFI